MDANTPETATMLELIARHGTDLKPPATEAMIADAEARLGVAFPPSYRAALLRHNGFNIGGNAFQGVPDVTDASGSDVVANTLECREMSASRVEDGYADAGGIADHDLLLNSVVIEDSGGSGNCYWLLCGHTDAQGECPVGHHDHETDQIYAIEASSLPRLVWFLCDAARRTPMGLYAAEDESPWPYDEAWTVKQDPAIGPWLAFWRERDDKFVAAKAALRASLEPYAPCSTSAMDTLFGILFQHVERPVASPAEEALATERLIGTWVWQGDPNARLTLAEDGIVRGAWVVKNVAETLRYEKGFGITGRWRIRKGLLQSALTFGERGVQIAMDDLTFDNDVMTLRCAIVTNPAARVYVRS